MKELIKDNRLTPTMKRVRSGSRQMFREPNKDRAFTNEKNADVILEHENIEMYAELIDGNWYWVNGCGACNGEGRSSKTYIECDKHNVCRECGIKRSEVKEGSVWGGSNGWICHPCHDYNKKIAKKEAISKFKAEKKTEHDFMYTDTPLCPHCGSSLGNEIRESEEIECGVCDGKVNIEIDWTPSYTTSKVNK